MAKRRSKGLSDDEIKGLLQREIKSAKTADDTELAAKRREALEYFDGNIPDLEAEVGRSSVVSRDFADAMGWLLPGLMDIFASSDKMVQAEPVGPEDEQEAKDKTDALNYIFWKENPGYRILRDTEWDSLGMGNGIVKVWHDDTPEVKTSFHSGLTDEDLAKFEADESVEITHQTTETINEQIEDPTTGQTITIPVDIHEIKVKRTNYDGCRRLDCIPPEDYLRSDDPPGTKRPRFEGQRQYITRSELIKMGFDRKKVMDLGSANEDTAEQQARNDGYVPPRGVADKSMETVEYIEGYLQCDVDGDDIAEAIQVHYAGNSSGGDLLDWEVWEDEGPFFDVPCDPVPHRWDAKSIFDETRDIQRVKTVLWRAALDNTYASNNPTRFVKGKLLNPDELFSPSFGGALFGDVNASVTDLPVPFVANHSYEALTYADEIVQRRTGVGRQTMALDPDTLQNQTTTANQNNKEAARSQVDLIARDQAELGWKPIFYALLNLEIKHQKKPKTITLGKRTITYDPRHWKADSNLTINVGLGTGSRDKDMVMLGSIAQDLLLLTDKAAAAGFPEEAIDMVPRLLSALRKKAESSGLRNTDYFFPEIGPQQITDAKAKIKEAQNKPDPAVQMAEQKAAMDAQTKDAQSQRDHEYRMAQLPSKQEMDKIYADNDLKLKQYQTDKELELKASQLVDELALKEKLGLAELALKKDLAAMGQTLNGTGAGVSSDVNLGGDPG